MEAEWPRPPPAWLSLRKGDLQQGRGGGCTPQSALPREGLSSAALPSGAPGQVTWAGPLSVVPPLGCGPWLLESAAGAEGSKPEKVGWRWRAGWPLQVVPSSCPLRLTFLFLTSPSPAWPAGLPLMEQGSGSWPVNCSR